MTIAACQKIKSFMRANTWVVMWFIDFPNASNISWCLQIEVFQITVCLDWRFNVSSLDGQHKKKRMETICESSIVLMVEGEAKARQRQSQALASHPPRVCTDHSNLLCNIKRFQPWSINKLKMASSNKGGILFCAETFLNLSNSYYTAQRYLLRTDCLAI